MAIRPVVFLFLVTVGLVAAQFEGCDVVANQTIKISKCYTNTTTVDKVFGFCPMSDIIMATPICKDISTTFIDSHEVSTPHCITSYHRYSNGFESPAERRGTDDENTCVIAAAACLNKTVVAPKKRKCDDNVSNFDDCNVVENQNIDINNCTLASDNVAKVNGHCPMSDLLIPFEVCTEVVTSFVSTHEMSTPRCVLSYDLMSVGSPVKRQAGNDDKTCEIEKGTCYDDEEKIPKTRTCTGYAH